MIILLAEQRLAYGFLFQELQQIQNPDEIDMAMLQDNAGHVVIQAPPPVLTSVPAAVTASPAAVLTTSSPPPIENSNIFLYESSANTYLSEVRIWYLHDIC